MKALKQEKFIARMVLTESNLIDSDCSSPEPFVSRTTAKSRNFSLFPRKGD